MSNKAVVICGSTLGDEGKGLMTDYFCHQNPEAINIRFNGSCQSGHTSVTPDNKRWVFSHFGAGTFNKNITFLSKYFVVNPTMFRIEHQGFYHKFGFKPKVVVDARSVVTTPYEMIVNQIIETNRQKTNSNHGSVGIGFGETLEREEKFDIHLDVETLNNELQCQEISSFLLRLKLIKNQFVPTRLHCEMSEFDDMFDSEQIIEKYLEDCEYFLDNVVINNNKKYLVGKDLIFEGAQGLFLDQNYGYFPYVTRSNCGLKNVVELINHHFCDKHELEVVYVTRAYVTRHGVGPLKDEDPNFSRYLRNIDNETNVTNEFQQNFRYAPFNQNLFEMITTKDFVLHAPKKSKMIKVMTCLDQLSKVSLKNLRKSVDLSTFNLFSLGPTREDVKLAKYII